MLNDKQKERFEKKKKKLLSPYHKLKGGWEKILSMLPNWLSPWVRDITDVTATVLVIIIILKIAFGADMIVPLVVVTSGSMVHATADNSWATWMGDRGLSNEQIYSFPMTWGFNMGDMILVRDPNPRLGDIIIYERDLDHMVFSSRDPIIHRVVGVAKVKDYVPISKQGTLDCHTLRTLQPFVEMIRQCQNGKKCAYTRFPEGGDFEMYITKGDNNAGSDQCSSRLKISHPVTDAQVTGRALLRLPYLGWPKLLMNIIWQLITFQI